MDVGQGHLVLGKVARELSAEETALIKQLHPSADLDNAVTYNRVLLSGVVYTCSLYRRGTTTNDSVICFMDGSGMTIGMAEKYVSFCSTTCRNCKNQCTHVVVVKHHSIISDVCRHIHSIDNHAR